MARGDGKARRGNTRGTVSGAPPKTKDVKRMAPGGLLASSTRDGGWAGAGTGSLSAAAQAQRSSISPGAGNVSAGSTPGGNAGGVGASRDRQDTVGYSPSAQRDMSAVRANYAEKLLVRSGPNAVQSLTEASGGLSNLARQAIDYSNAQIQINNLKKAGLYNPPPKQITDRIEPTPDWKNPNFSPFDTTNQAKPRPIDTAPITPTNPFISGITSVAARSAAMLNPAAASARLGPNAAQAMVGAGVSPDAAIRAAMSINRSGAPAAVTPPARPSRPEDVFGGFNYTPAKPSRPEDVFGGFNYTPSVRQPTPGPRMMSSAQDYASIVPGSVSFTAQDQFQPFAQTPMGQGLLKKSQSVMSWEESQKLKENLPPNTKYSWEPVPPNSGYTSYPIKVDTGFLGVRSGYVNIPNAAGTTVPGAIKVGTWNPGAPAAPSPTTSVTYSQSGPSSFGGQTQRAEASFAPKQITDRVLAAPSYGVDALRASPAIRPKVEFERLTDETGPTFTPGTTPKIADRLPGLTGPTGPTPSYKPYTPPTPKPPGVVTLAPGAPLPRIREGQVIIKDGRRYQMRGGKLYNFNVGQPQKKEGSGTLPLKDGGRTRSDGIAYRGKTKGRYI